MNRIINIFLSFSNKERRTFLISSFLFIVSAFLLVVVLIGKATQAVPTSGGSFTEGFVGQPIFVNPVLASSEIDESLVRLVFSSIQDISTKIEISEEGRVWTVRLKEDLVWSDGEKLTSDDVVFTVQAIQDPDAKSPLFANWQGVRVDRSSELQVQFTLTAPYAFFPDNLKDLYILPKHIFENVPPSNWKISDFNLSPVGSGPYEFTSFNKRPDGFVTNYHLTVNPDSASDPTLIQNFTLSFFEEVKDLIGAFNKAQVDAFDGIQVGDLETIRRSYEIVPFRLPNYYAVFINQSKNLALKEGAVREALSLAIPKKDLISEVFNNKATLVNGPIPPGAAYFSPATGAPHSQPDKARELLQESGWETVEGSPVRVKDVKGTEIELQMSLVVPQIEFLVDTANYLKKVWEEVGFEVDLIVLPPREVADVVIKNRDYELILFGNFLNGSSDLFPFWHSSGRFDPGLNLALFNDSRADELIESTRLNFDDTSRLEQFNELQERIVGNSPAVFLYAPDYLYITSKNLKGVGAAMIRKPADRFLDIEEWHLKTVRVLK